MSLSVSWNSSSSFLDAFAIGVLQSSDDSQPDKWPIGSLSSPLQASRRGAGDQDIAKKTGQGLKAAAIPSPVRSFCGIQRAKTITATRAAAPRFRNATL